METTRLLQTKLSIPPVRAELVPRPRLLARLNEGLAGKLTLISAPAGFGKTTLLACWTKSCRLPVAWLSLDDSDNEPVRFMAYLVASLEKAGGLQEIKEQPEVYPPHEGSGAASIHENRLANVINQMAAQPVRFVLILDDYHTITNQLNHKTIRYLIEHLPPQMHLVIASRADPPLPLARLRGQGQLNELRSIDLRFTSEEAADFMQKLLGKELAFGDLSSLENKTEGWAAGLQMAALALQSPSLDQPQKLSDFIRDFTGSNRFVLDYLVEEVLERQPADIQDFLLQTSILERMSAPLCEEIVGTLKRSNVETLKPSNEILEYLDRANLFIIPLDDHREWFRYHRLFADLLRRRLQYAHRSLVPELHRRASHWFERNGFLEEAVEHAFLAKDMPRAADLVENAAEAMMMLSQVTTLRNWLDRLPDEQIATRPSLCVYHAWALFVNNQSLETVEARLALVDSKAEPLSSKAAPLKAFIAAFRGALRQAASLSRQALEQLPEEDHFLRGMAYLILATSELSEGDPQAGYRALDQAAQISRQTGNILVSVMVLVSLADNCRKQGQLRRAEMLYRQALDLAVDTKGKRLPIAGRALLGLGDLMYEWNRLEEAEQYLVEGVGLLREWGTLPLYTGFINLARVKHARGDYPGAILILERARQQTVETETTQIDDWVVALTQASYWIAERKFERVEQWAENRGLLKEIDVSGLSEGETYAYAHMRKYELIVLARLRLAQGRMEEALSVLDTLLPQVERIERLGLVIEILALKAIAFHQQGMPQSALAALNKALSMAEPEDYMRLFLDSGAAMRDLLSAAAQGGIHPGYASRLLANFEQERAAEESRQAGRPARGAPVGIELVESLSERELEVLFLLRSRLTVPEIAEELCVAESTVRSHVKSIYSKLTVHRRTDAIQRAEELGMLPKMQP
ncbi:MAG: tetratricopeptide repeat protein [Chloroflexi bacterium]|nr:tetratricopeptide repeat protein [Chloroflexota bacterium]